MGAAYNINAILLRKSFEHIDVAVRITGKVHGDLLHGEPFFET